MCDGVTKGIQRPIPLHHIAESQRGIVVSWAEASKMNIAVICTSGMLAL